MNENELKSKLQEDAARFRPEFSEELLAQIMTGIRHCPFEEPRRSAEVEDFLSERPFFSRTSSMPAREEMLRSPLFHAVLIGASILMGIGLWSLMNGRISNDSQISVRPQLVTLQPSDPLEQNTSSARALTPNSIPVGTLFEIPVKVSLVNASASSDLPSRTDASGLHQVRQLSSVILPGRGIVRLRRPNSPQNDPEEENSDLSVLDQEALSGIWNDTSSVLNAPITWIFEEE